MADLDLQPVQQTGGLDLQPVQPPVWHPGTASHSPAGSEGGGTSEEDVLPPLPIAAQMAVATAANRDERNATLKKIYGNRVHMEGRAGEMDVAVVDGKRYRTQPGFTANMAGTSPEIAGSIYGAETLGAAGGTLGPVGAAVGGVAGAGLGAFAGYEAKQAAKAAAGTYRQTPQQNLKGAAQVAGGAMVGQGLGGALTGIAHSIRGPIPRALTDTTPAITSKTDQLLKAGARPPAASTMPGATHIQWIESFADKLAGKSTAIQEANTQAIIKEMTTVLRKAGVPVDQIDLQATDATARSTAEAGTHFKNAIQAHQDNLTNAVRVQADAADRDVTKRIAQLDALSRRAPAGPLGEDVAIGLRSARRDFGTAMSKAYQRVDQMVGNEPLVPVQLMVKEGKRIAALRPQSVQSPLTKEMSRMGPKGAEAEDPDDVSLLAEFLGTAPPKAVDGKISFADAQRMRTILREKSEDTTLTRGVTKGEMASLERSVDQSIQLAGRDPKAEPAVRLLNAVDARYRSGIKQFDDYTVRRLVQGAKAGTPADPGAIAAQIIRPGQSASIATVRKMVGPQTWQRVQGEDWQNLLKGATRPDGKISGLKLLRVLQDRREANGVDITKLVHGDKIAGQLKELAEGLAARGEKLDATNLTPSSLKDAIVALRAREGALKQFKKEDFLGTLADPRKTPEDVYTYLMRPGQETLLEHAVSFFDKQQANGPAVTALRQHFAESLVDRLRLNLLQSEGPQSISSMLRGYTPRQRALLLPNGLDRDLMTIDDNIKFLFPQEGNNFAGALAAGAIQRKNMVSRLTSQGIAAGMRMIVTHPQMIRRLAIGLEDTKTRSATRLAIRSLITGGSIGLVEPDED